MWLTKLYVHAKQFIDDKDGASAIEYALVATMVAVAVIAFIHPIGEAVKAIFTSINTALTTTP